MESQRGAAGSQSYSGSRALETGICLSFRGARFGAHQNGVGNSQVPELPGDQGGRDARVSVGGASPGLRGVSAPGRCGPLLLQLTTSLMVASSCSRRGYVKCKF